MPSRAAVSASAIAAHVVYSQLREIRVAGNRDGLPHVQRAVGAVADIVLDWTVPAGNGVAGAAVGQGAAQIGAMRQAGIGAQRGDGRHQLERRARRILAVAGAVQQFVRRGRGRARARRLGLGLAHQRQHVAGGCRHHHHRAFCLSGLGHVLDQNLARFQLQASVQRQVHVAVARQHARHRRIARLMPVAHQAGQLGKIVALQRAVGIVLHQRSVGGVEILGRAQIADHVLDGRAERDNGGCPGASRPSRCEIPMPSYSARWRSSSSQLLVASGMPLRS